VAQCLYTDRQTDRHGDAVACGLNKRLCSSFKSCSCFLLLGAASCDPEVLDLSGGEVEVRPPKGGRLVLRVAPLDNEKVRHIFLGFNESWERDLWMDWLMQVSNICAVSCSNSDGAIALEASLWFYPESVLFMCAPSTSLCFVSLYLKVILSQATRYQDTLLSLEQMNTLIFSVNRF
jgi:hypothetical protein